MVGMLVHLDGSTHEWIAGLPRQDLVVALDDADGRILYARFFPQEGTASTLPSRPGESHPEPLTEPDVSLSTYPARATQ